MTCYRLLYFDLFLQFTVAILISRVTFSSTYFQTIAFTLQLSFNLWKRVSDWLTQQCMWLINISHGDYELIVILLLACLTLAFKTIVTENPTTVCSINRTHKRPWLPTSLALVIFVQTFQELSWVFIISQWNLYFSVNFSFTFVLKL